MYKYFLLYSLISFTLDAKPDNWVQKSSFLGGYVTSPFSFSIGVKGYVGTGQDNSNNVTSVFWEYEPTTDIWTQKADFAGSARWAAIGFSIGNKGYAGLGSVVNNISSFQDFWEYDPFTNNWIQKAAFGGTSRYAAVEFVIGNKGYVGFGISGFTLTNDLWQYDPVGDSWNQKSSIPVTGLSNASAFVLFNRAYVIGGLGPFTFYSNELWEYSSSSDTWSQKSSFPGLGRCDAPAFSVCNKGYYGLGEKSVGAYGTDWWEYDLMSDSWTLKMMFPGSSRDETCFFVIDNKGYVGIGGRDAYATGIFFNDFWEYVPDTSCGQVFPICNFNSASQICLGECSNFTNLSLNSLNFQWYFPGAIPDTSTVTNPTNICYPNPGSYDVQLISTNTNGSDTLLLSNYITVYPAPSPQSITQASDTLLAISGSASYQWYFNGNIISGATDYFYIATASGDYNIVAIDSNGCEVEAAIYNVIAEVQSTVDNRQWTIYPNPARDQLTISIPMAVGSQLAIDRLTIFNLLGESVQTIKQVSSSSIEIDVSPLKTGLYFIEIVSDHNKLYGKFVKQ